MTNLSNLYKTAIFVIILCFHFNILICQQAFFKKIVPDKTFSEYKIQTIFQDSDGFIWIGTNSGTFRFDGSKYSLLDPPETINSNTVTAIFEDGQNKMWLGYENGIITIFDKNEHTKLIAKGDSPQSKITSIVEDANSVIWIATYGSGLYYYENDTLYNLNSNDGLADDFIYSLILDDQNRIWAGTDNGISISHFNRKIESLSVTDGLPDFIVHCLEKDKEGNIWIGMQDKGIAVYNTNSDEFQTPPGLQNWEFGSVQSILNLKECLWISTDENGIIEYDKKDDYLTIQTNDIGRVNNMFTDLEGNIWLASLSNIYLSCGKKIEFQNSFNDTKFTNIHALIADSYDNIWFANDNGLFRYNPYINLKHRNIKKYQLDLDLASQKIMSLYEDPYGYIWIGTFGKGIIRLNPENGLQDHIAEDDGFINGNVLSVKGSEKDIWFATLGGASQCRINDNLRNINYKPRFNNFGQAEGLSNSFIYSLFIDASNRVWFATDGNGIYIFENNVFKNYSHEEGISKVIYSITADPSGNIWLNSANNGIYKYNGKQFTNMSKEAGLSGLAISGIITNEKDELIISHENGINILNTITNEILFYGENIGLSNINPDLNTLTKDSRGNIWIGTSKGIIKYSSDDEVPTARPVTYISNVSVFLEKISPFQSNIFNYDKNHFSFDYIGLWYQYPEKVQYLIKLEGHDLDWIHTNNKTVIYSNLAPGEYVFNVKSNLVDSFDSSNLASYRFIIKKPFWTEYWFYIGIVVAFALIIVSVIRLREKRIRKKQELLRERIRFQFENLKNQINPHFLFNSFSTLIALIDFNKEDAIEYVEELSNLFRNVLEFKDLDVITLKEELSVMNNYYALQKKRFGESLQLNISDSKRFELYSIPPMTLQMLIENAIKHNIVSKDKSLNINIYFDEKEQLLIIENNIQEKKKEVPSIGIGISNIKSRYMLLTDKKIKVVESEGKFKVELPLIK